MQCEIGEALMEAAKRGCLGAMHRCHLGHCPLQRLKQVPLAQQGPWLDVISGGRILLSSARLRGNGHKLK